MPDDHSNADDADLYGEDAYDDDEPRDRIYSDNDDAYDDDEYAGYGEGEYEEYDEDEGGSWWDEGLIGLLLVAGVVLFLFPEPFTSTIGIALIGLGVIAWIADALM